MTKKHHLERKSHARFFIVLFAMLLLISVVSGCGSSSSKNEVSSALAIDSAAKPAAAIAPGNQTIADQVKSGKPSGQSANDPASVIKQQGEDGFNRKIIYTANMLLQVKNYDAAQKQLRELVSGNGAYILNFSEQETKTEIGGTYTIKVASDGFVSMLDSIETISKAKQRNVQGQDVTEEFVDLSARLKAKETVEKRLLDFMGKAAKSDELLAFSKELAVVQEEIERIKGRMRYIEQNVSYSTIEVKLVQPIDTVTAKLDEEDDSLLSRMGNTIVKSFRVLINFGEGLAIALTALLPFGIPGAIIVWLIVLWVRRSRRIGNERRAEERLTLQRMSQASEIRDVKTEQNIEPVVAAVTDNETNSDQNDHGNPDDNVEKK